MASFSALREDSSCKSRESCALSSSSFLRSSSCPWDSRSASVLRVLDFFLFSSMEDSASAISFSVLISLPLSSSLLFLYASQLLSRDSMRIFLGRFQPVLKLVFYSAAIGLGRFHLIDCQIIFSLPCFCMFSISFLRAAFRRRIIYLHVNPYCSLRLPVIEPRR